MATSRRENSSIEAWLMNFPRYEASTGAVKRGSRRSLRAPTQSIPPIATILRDSIPAWTNTCFEKILS